MKIPDKDRYLEERKKWKEAGEPLRSPERIKEIFTICSSCPESIKITSKVRQCGVCTCMLRESGFHLNKIAWATTSCPLKEPLWTEEIEQKVEVVEPQPQTQQFIKRPPKPQSSCGCGG